MEGLSAMYMQDAILSRNYGVGTWLFKQISFWDPCMFESLELQTFKKRKMLVQQEYSFFFPLP